MLKQITARLTRKYKSNAVTTYWREFYADVARLQELAR